MKKKIFGRQLSRDIHERKALFRGLIHELVMRESIQTTEAKAKSIRGQVEKLITKAKRGSSASMSVLQPWLNSDALEKVVKELSVRFAQRPGGYTRIIKLGKKRFGDNAKMVVIEFVEKSSAIKVMNDKKVKEIKEDKKETIEATVKVKKEKSKKPQQPKKEKTTTKKQRPPSKAEMEKRKAGE